MTELEKKLEEAQNNIYNAISLCRDIMQMPEFKDMKAYRQAMLADLEESLRKLTGHIEL